MEQAYKIYTYSYISIYAAIYVCGNVNFRLFNHVKDSSHYEVLKPKYKRSSKLQQTLTIGEQS